MQFTVPHTTVRPHVSVRTQVRIDPGVEHFLHEFWGMVGHLVNTLIFVMAGMIIILKVKHKTGSQAAGPGRRARP